MRTITLGIFLLWAPVVQANAAQISCVIGPASAAATNASTLETLEWAPFRRPELGWAIYATRIGKEIGSSCPAASPGFAAALAKWQASHDRPPTGIVDSDSFAVMNTRWTLSRPFVVQTRDGSCPDPPLPELLATAADSESYGGKTIQLRRDALAAYRRMIAAARMSLKSAEPQGFAIFSGFRDPAADDLRCMTEGNCLGIVRAGCSAHRTGLAIDMYVGNAPGFRADDSADINRRAMVKGLPYRWLVANAARFGFVNYVFEPWHWEWTPTLPKNGSAASSTSNK